MTSESVESLYDLIDYLFDKMNIKVEMTEQQIVEFMSNFSNKVIVWTILSNTIKIVVALALLLILMTLTNKIVKKYNLRSIIKSGFKEDGSTTQFQKSFWCSIIIFIDILFQIYLLIKIFICIYIIFQCSIFPEKVILDFINVYL